MAFPETSEELSEIELKLASALAQGIPQEELAREWGLSDSGLFRGFRRLKKQVDPNGEMVDPTLGFLFLALEKTGLLKTRAEILGQLGLG
jgi:hypothetical protein